MQSAYKQHMKFAMKDLDIDSYTATFDRLTAAAGWEADAQCTIDKFVWGLKDNVHWFILSQDTEPATMAKWQEAAQSEVHKVFKIVGVRLNFHSRQKPCDFGTFQTGQAQCSNLACITLNNSGIVPVEVLTNIQPLVLSKKLMDGE